jgi:putative transposase
MRHHPSDTFVNMPAFSDGSFFRWRPAPPKQIQRKWEIVAKLAASQEGMAKRRTAAQIQAVLSAVEKDRAKGLAVADSCRRHGITEQSYYRWRSRMTDEADEATRKVRELASEVERLKQCLAEVMLENQMLREVAKKSGDRIAAAFGGGVSAGGVRGVGAAKALGRSRSTVRYRPKARADEASLVTAIRRRVRRHPRYGSRRIRAQLVVKGWSVNVKRVRRLMVSLGCQPRKRRKSKGNRTFPGTETNGCTRNPATAPDDVWTCDFVHDRTISGGSLKWLSVVDEYTREVLLLMPAASMTAADVRRAFGRLVGWRGETAGGAVRQRRRVCQGGPGRVVADNRGGIAGRRPGESVAERVRGIVPRQTAG